MRSEQHQRAGPRNVLVTGAARGLGRSIALQFGMNSCNVGINYVKNDDLARATAEQIARFGGSSTLCRADVSMPNQVEAMFARLKDEMGLLDVLVNNAGVTQDALVMQTSEESWQRIMDVNLKGAAWCARSAAEMMQDGGHIINVASLSGMIGRPGQGAYAMAKGALVGLTKSLAAELGSRSICVNAVLPGYLPTDMGLAAPKAMQRAVEESVLDRLSDIDDTAKFIVQLSGMNGVSGQVFNLDSRLWGGP